MPKDIKRQKNFEEDKDKQIKDLTIEIKDYQKSLEILYTLLETLKEALEEAPQKVQGEIVTTFFLKLKGTQYSNVLDNLVLVENNLVEATRLKLQIPKEILSLNIIFDQLIKMIKDYDLTPIEEIGKIFKVNCKDILHMNYIGQPFMTDEEIKVVEVWHSGWRYKDIIISIPIVREI